MGILITLPAALPLRRVRWDLVVDQQINRSGWTKRRQVSSSSPIGMWRVSAEFVPVIGEENARKWRYFFTALNGMVNRFPVVASLGAQHNLTNPTVSSGAAGANTMTVSGAPVGLPAGSFMTVPLADGTKQLVCLTGNVSGSTITFMPPLRAAAQGAATIESVLPYAEVSLTGSSVGWDVDPGRNSGFAFEAEEAF